VRDRAAPASGPVTLRRARIRDLAELMALEEAVFTTDKLSRRSFRHFIASPQASLIVAEEAGTFAGYVLVLYPPRSQLARLYSIAVAPHIDAAGSARRQQTSHCALREVGVSAVWQAPRVL
jgi:ribosomal protein S18 acetylase RimI-like enzyme